MTGRREREQEKGMAEAIRQIEDAKRRKAGLPPIPAAELSALVQATQQASQAALQAARVQAAGVQPADKEAADEQTPQEAPPKRRGRPPGSSQSKGGRATGAEPEQPTTPDDPAPAAAFGVKALTAHGPLALIEVRERADLDALLADRTLAPQIAARLDERFALVLPGNMERLLTALRKAGHTPKVEART